MILRKISNIIEKIENFIVFLLVISMIILSFVQIMLRNLFAISIFWIDDLTRHAVIWVGFISMSIVSAYGKHINIDILSRFFRGKSRRGLDVFRYFVSAIISAILVYASIKFVMYEKEGGDVSLTLKIPVWYLELFFPVVFSLTTFRFILLVVETIRGVRKEEEKVGDFAI